jgi:hypothetical protein
VQPMKQIKFVNLIILGRCKEQNKIQKQRNKGRWERNWTMWSNRSLLGLWNPRFKEYIIDGDEGTTFSGLNEPPD